MITFTQGVSAENVSYLDFKEIERKVESDKYDSPFRDDPYFKIDSIKVTEIPADESLIFIEEEEKEMSKDLGTVIMSIEKLIALGTKVWEIIKKGKPVTNVSMSKPVSVLPTSEDPTSAFNTMSGWSAPTVRKYRIEYTNLLGMNVISFDYTVYFQHSGQFEGNGEYITGLTVKASNVAVSWGFEFNASSELETISNRGSMQSPMAAATILINYRASSVLRDIQSSESFHVSGNGEIVKF